MTDSPSNLIAAVRYFSDLSVCNEYMRGIKWPGGELCCHHCGSVRIGEIKTRSMLRCKDCRKQFSYKVGPAGRSTVRPIRVLRLTRVR